MRFWDSSALVPLFVREERSPFLEALVADDPDMVVAGCTSGFASGTADLVIDVNGWWR
jgi:hypothetical protein